LAACPADAQVEGASPPVRGEVLSLAVLWAFSPEKADDEGGLIAGDLVGRILGPRAAVDSDGTPLALPGWEDDDVIMAPDSGPPKAPGGAMTLMRDDHVDIGVLVAWALRPNQRPGRSPEYERVLERYRTVAETRAAADAVLHGLGAQVPSWRPSPIPARRNSTRTGSVPSLWRTSKPGSETCASGSAHTTPAAR
jgi:hypothetical protein